MNRIKRFSLALFGLVLLLGLVFTGCQDPNRGGQERVTVTFELGEYEGEAAPGTPPAPVTLFKGGTMGERFPSNPRWTGYGFLGWYRGNTRFRNNTVINEDVTLVGRWREIGSVAPQPSPSQIEALFSTDNGFPEQLSDSRKIWGTINPIITFAYIADPVPMWYCHANPPCKQDSSPGSADDLGCDECRLYMYGSNDTITFNASGGQIQEPFGTVIQGLRIVSSDDLVNWTEHGCANFVAKNSTHPLHPNPTEKLAAYANDTWAPSAEWRTLPGGQQEFYLYWCNSGTNTSVVRSTGPNASPIGPWDNAGHTTQPMIPRNASLNANSEWLFDPGTMIDHDGVGYMVLGGGGGGYNPGNARRVQLAGDMVSNPGLLDIYIAPYMFEASDLWKWDGIYYLNYTTNWSSGAGFNNIELVYMMNTEGPLASFPAGSEGNMGTEWGRARGLLRNESNGDSTNHGSLFDFRGKPYLVYHSNMQCRAYGAGRMRTAHLLDVTIQADGVLDRLSMGRNSRDGVYTREDRWNFQVKDFNPYLVHEAETMAIGGGVYTKLYWDTERGVEELDAIHYDPSVSNGHSLASIDTGDWVGIYGVNFDLNSGAGATKFNARVKLPDTSESDDFGNYFGAIEIRLNPEIQGAGSEGGNLHQRTLNTGNDNQTRITGGDVIGWMYLKAYSTDDEGEWLNASINLNRTVTGKHDVAFVFYSSRSPEGENRERHNIAVRANNDGRAINEGFEIDTWWFE